MYASWVRGEKPRRAMSRIMRVRSALMSHLHQGMGWRGFCASGASYIRKDDHTAIDINSERRLCRTEVRTYRVSGLVQLELGRPAYYRNPAGPDSLVWEATPTGVVENERRALSIRR